MKLTLQRLVELDACEEQRTPFAEHFGKEVHVTERLCEKFAGVFYWDWAAQNLLIALARDEYRRAVVPALDEYIRVCESAMTEYRRAMVPAQAEYECAMASARDEYDRAVDSGRAEYERTVASALAEYDRTIAPALVEYTRVKAITFARLYNSQALKGRP